VPRPARLDHLQGGPAPPEMPGMQSLPLLLFVLSDEQARREERRELDAVEKAYEEVLGVDAQDLLDLQEAESLFRLMAPPKGEQDRAPEGTVVVLVLAGTKPEELPHVCSKLVGRPPNGSDAVTSRSWSDDADAALLSEWHWAIRWQGRLAICSVRAEGAFRFSTTLRQVLETTLRLDAAGRPMAPPPDSSEVATRLRLLPSFILEDWPHHQWRGLQLDCVRHYMQMEFIKKYLRAMAYYKANVFHWHLTDDQAWRLYIPKRPKLVKANKWSQEYYTTEMVREVVEFAASLFIKVLPTVETPGHALASLAAYPEIACEGDHFEVPKTRVGTYNDIMCVSKKELADFAQDVFEEVVKLFPHSFVHVGGDETPTLKWERSDHVKAFAGKAGLSNLGPDIMEAWYCFLGNLLGKYNRSIVMWDDHFAKREWSVSRKCPGAEQSWVVQAWKLESPVGNEEYISRSFPFRTIASPMRNVYLDYPVASIDYNKTMAWRIAEPGTKSALGGCATMWTEDSEPKDVGAKVYPRYLAVSERLWGGPVGARSSDGHHLAAEALPRVLDESAFAASKRHCADEAPLSRDLGFKCGKFAHAEVERSPLWAGADVQTTMEVYALAFRPDRALDGDEESYFWAVAPKSGDKFLVSWLTQSRDPALRLGKWFIRLSAKTGAADRPGDQLDNGDLAVAQWLPSSDNASKYELAWQRVGRFQGGSATADPSILEQGPVAAVQITCTVAQTKWMSLVEIFAEEGPGRPVPSLSDLPDRNSPPRRYAPSLGGAHSWPPQAPQMAVPPKPPPKPPPTLAPLGRLPALV